MRLRPPIAIPYPHYMAFAPLDAWLRVILSPPAWVPVRYWARLAFGLFTSCIGTVLTLPERLVLAPVLRMAGRRSGLRLDHAPGAIVILGYFRSGTTHLHYLMSCDPRVRTPTWCEVLAPQGFALSWSFLRLFMIPFLSAKRPQDDVAIGPDWPAEDDFATGNWVGASSLPGRFVIPRLHAHYDRFHSLTGLNERERRRWRRAQWAFLWKLARLAPGRAILLKSPSHTGRVRELADLFGGNVKFVHISREPGAVLRSNVAMARRLSVFNLQDPLPGDDIESRLAREYLETERTFLAEAAAIPPGRLAHIRYEDLVADPLGELRRVYQELGLEWSPELERRAGTYLLSVRDYRAATKPEAVPAATMSPAAPPAAALAQLARAFGHDRPPRPKAPLPLGLEDHHRSRAGPAMLAAAVVATLASILWIAQASWFRDRNDWLVWPLGILVGLTALRVARVGSPRLGAWAAGLTLLAFFAISIPATYYADYAFRTSPPFPVDYRDLPMRDWEWYHILKASGVPMDGLRHWNRVGSLATNNLFWLFMGVVTAYRFASREFVHPPGRG
ncbi:MAG: sulfotransferase [Phycisphaerales bacterium]